MNDLQSTSTRALELSGLQPNEHVDVIAVHERQHQMNAVILELQSLSQHMHDNAFEGVWFGVNPEGILGALPTDLMHAFLHGLIPYVVKTIISNFTTREKHKLDLVDEILVPIHSGERSKYPRTNFARGILNLKLLTASEWAGVAFAMVLLVNSNKGFKKFQTVCNRKRWKIFCSQLDNGGGIHMNTNDNDNDALLSSDNEDESNDDVDIENDSASDNADDENDGSASDGSVAEVALKIIDAYDILYVLEMMLSFHAC